MTFIIEAPLAMLGLFTLLIPLVIHLLSKARPPVIAFAHIAFIKVKTTPKLRQLRLTQLILLGLRMLMLLIATLILAQVYWPKTQQQVDSHILVTEDWLDQATDVEKQKLVDQANDSKLILLSTINRSISGPELTAWKSNNQPTSVLNLWSKVADYSVQLPANVAISVYTTNRIKQFIGEKVQLSIQPNWHVKKVPIETTSQTYSTNIKVIYDDSSTSLLVYLRAAFEAIKMHSKLDINVNFIRYDRTNTDSLHLLTYDKIINLSQQPFAPKTRPFDAQWQSTHIGKAELKNVEDADFVLTLAGLLFSSQHQAWWLENTRLSAEQIKQPSSLRVIQDPPTLNPKSSNTGGHLTSMHIGLVLLLALIFMLERLLSEWPNNRLKTELDE